MPSQKVAEMIKSIKTRFSRVSDKTTSRINQSNAVFNLKRVIQSTPDLLKMGDQTNHNFSTPELAQPGPSDFYPHSSDEAFSTLSTVMDSTLSSPACLQHHRAQEDSHSMPKTKVLFSPSKEATASGSGKKFKLKFAIRKNKLANEFPVVKSATFNIPMIILTMPDDEQAYILHRPIPPISTENFLEVPTRLCPIQGAPEPKKVSHKGWPHPAGPWLRLTDFEESGSNAQSAKLNWSMGWRLGTGAVIGWDPECIEALGISLPPQLPTEQDLQTLALVEQISMSLDQAQDALYGFYEEEWESDMDEDEFKPMTLAPSWMFPPCLEALESA